MALDKMRRNVTGVKPTRPPPEAQSHDLLLSGASGLQARYLGFAAKED